MRTEYTSMKIPKSTIVRLKSIQRPRQALAGVIEELIDNTKIVMSPDTLTRLERYRVAESDTIDDLVKNALNENLEFEKQMGKKA